MHDLRPPGGPLRRTQHPVHRAADSGFPKPRVRWYSPADLLTEKEMDGRFFPSTRAAYFGIRMVPPPVILAKVAMSCPMLYKLAEYGAGQHQFFGLALPLYSEVLVC